MKSNVVAKRYASALYEHARSENAANVEVELAAIASLYAENADVRAIVRNPVVSADEKLAVFASLQKQVGFSQLVYVFITILVHNNRMDLIEEIAREVKLLFMASRGEVEAEVTFASPADDALRAELSASLAAVTGKKVQFIEAVDANLLGGVRVQIGSKLYDASVRGQLDSVRDLLLK